MVTGRYGATAAILADGRVLMVGGASEAPSDPSLASLGSAELFDGRTQTFSLTGAMTTGRYAPTATVLLDGRVLIAGGDAVGPGVTTSIRSAELFK